jgi:hypothetical protein
MIFMQKAVLRFENLLTFCEEENERGCSFYNEQPQSPRESWNLLPDEFYVVHFLIKLYFEVIHCRF